MNKLYSLLLQARAKAENEEGQGVIEYTLVAGVISIALFGAFLTLPLTDGVGNAVTTIVNTIDPPAPPAP